MTGSCPPAPSFDRESNFAILRQPKRFATGVITWQSLSWVFRVASVFFLLRAFHIPATAYTTALVLAVQSLSTLLPFTPGGIGTQQGLIVYVFRKQKIPDTRLLGYAIKLNHTYPA